MGRTCKFHGEAHGPGVYACDNQASGFHWCEEDADGDNSPGCFVPLAEAPVPDSYPVTLADVLAHHRRQAESSRADRAWHAEAVECLEVAIPRSAGCECGDDEACRFVRERDEARSEVERLRALLASSHEVRHADEAEVASLRSRVAELERWQGEAVPVLSFLLTLVPADVEVPESVWKLLERGEAQAIEAPG